MAAEEHLESEPHRVRPVREVVREPVHVQGASRTDSGVHAACQTAAFTTADDRRGPPDERLRLALNSRLPEDVVIRDLQRTRDDFQPISDCVAKGYVYRLWTGRDRPLWERTRVHHVHVALDHDAMNTGASLLVGTHDFASFQTNPDREPAPEDLPETTADTVGPAAIASGATGCVQRISRSTALSHAIAL